ncbi:hypothetical protein CHU98_g1879 [Xylaria longipes]|nr:hypothetical protein CHU98_g1879 [Xylaria longipes]
MNALLPARRVQELDLAVSNFCAVLTDEQRRDLSNIRNIPDADSIFVFTAQLDYKNRSRRGQSVGSRVSKVLQSTRDFCTVIDTYVSSHPEIAGLVWGSVKLTIQVVQAFYRSFEHEFQPDVDDIRRCSDSVKDAISLAKAHIDAQERKLQAKERTAASKHRDLLETILKKQSHDRKQQLLEAFCSHRPEKQLKQNQRKRFSDTASWIFEAAEFHSWMDTRDLPLLWCSGKRSGKTVVADRESLKVEMIMRSILRQRLPPATQLSEKTEERLRRLSDSSDIDEIVTFLHDITYTSRSSYIIIDGLDECERRDRVQLLEALSSLVAIAANTKLFLASRESLSEDIRTHFTAIRQVSMDNPGAHDDIGIYIHGILREKMNMEELRIGDSGLIIEIENALIQGADGMFLWVFFQVQELCEQACDEDIRHTIANLPEGLEDTFRRVLRRISSRRNSELARRTFPWIAAAARPLSLEEVREAIAIEIGQQYTKAERLCNHVNSIISSCENLLHIDEEDGSVQFAHHSIKQFLVEQPVPHQQLTDHDLRVFHIDLEEADHFIGEICITYFHFSDFQTTLSQLPKRIALPNPQDIALTALGSKWNLASKLGRKVLTRGASISVEADKLIKSGAGPALKSVYNNTHPFLKYASINWIIHTKNFRDSKSKTWNLWKKIIISGHALAITPWQPHTSNSDAHIHEWAIQAKHPAVLHLIDSSGELWRPTGWQVICEAIRDNNPAVIGVRLRSRSPGGVASYDIPECSTSASLNIIEKLLAVRADVNDMNWDETMLLRAARNGCLHIVGKGLSTIKPTVDSELGPAAGNEHLNVVETVPQGANISAFGLSVQFAFRDAARNGHFNIIERLLTAGAEINVGHSTDSGFRETALCSAAENGHLDIVEMLLTAGATVNVVSYTVCKTALCEAAKGGYLDIVERLLIAGASVNVRDGRGKAALYNAAEKGHLDIVERLLTVGADVHLEDGGNRIPLHIATMHNHQGVVERLVRAHQECDKGLTQGLDSRLWKTISY